MTTKTILTFAITDDLAKRITQYCEENDANRSKVLRRAIDEYLTQEGF